MKVRISATTPFFPGLLWLVVALASFATDVASGCESSHGGIKDAIDKAFPLQIGHNCGTEDDGEYQFYQCNATADKFDGFQAFARYRYNVSDYTPEVLEVGYAPAGQDGFILELILFENGLHGIKNPNENFKLSAIAEDNCLDASVYLDEIENTINCRIDHQDVVGVLLETFGKEDVSECELVDGENSYQYLTCNATLDDGNTTKGTYQYLEKPAFGFKPIRFDLDHPTGFEKLQFSGGLVSYKENDSLLPPYEYGFCLEDLALIETIDAEVNPPPSWSCSETHEEVVELFEDMFDGPYDLPNCVIDDAVATSNPDTNTSVTCPNSSVSCDEGLFSCESSFEGVYYARVDYKFFSNRVLNKTIPESVYLHYSFLPSPQANTSFEDTYNFVTGRYTYEEFNTNLETNETYVENRNVVEEECLDKLSQGGRIADEVDLYSTNAPSSLPSSSFPSSLPSGSPSSLPSSSPTSSTCISNFGGGKPGLRLSLEMLPGGSTGAFKYTLFNELDDNIPVWNGDTNRGLRIDEMVCLPFRECYILELIDEGAFQGDGFFEVILDGEQIIVSEPDFTGSLVYEFCLGDTEHCTDITREFKYRIQKGNNKIKKRNLDDCEELADKPAKTRKKICDAKFGRKGSAKVKTKCMETCGKVGRGDCEFLKTYGDNGPTIFEPIF